MASKKSGSGGSANNAQGVLLKLSACCAGHAESHAATPNARVTEQDELPEKCQRDITSICKILPKVEEAYVPEKHPHPKNLQHLCDFYLSVIDGRFCPHAPQVFDWGKGGTTVVPRIFSLYQHLTSKAILSNTVSVLKTEESTPVADTICTTIANMMSFIPSQRLQECLVRDLIHLAFDLAVIGEMLKTESSVQVSTFEETAAECKLTDTCVLTLNSMDSLTLTWTGTLDILQSLFKLQKSKRLSASFDETAESYEIINLPTTRSDSTWSFVLDNGELLSTAMSSVRRVLSSSPPEARASLVTRNKVSAAKLLVALLEDWKASSSDRPPVMTEVSLLVSRTVREQFQCIFDRQKEGHLPTKDDMLLSSLCGTLLCNTVVFPPTTAGSKPNVSAIRAAALNDLLECIPLMNAKSSPFVRDDVILSHVVLRAIHTALYTPSDKTTFPLIATAVNHCTLGGIFPSLFLLLQNEHLGNVAMRIISAMLSAGTDRSVDATTACHLAKTLYEREIANVEAAKAGAASERASNRSGSKKRGRSPQRSPYQLPLRIEQSPKRSRIGLPTNSQATIATPSPPSWSHSSGLTPNAGSSEAAASDKGSCLESLGNILFTALLDAKHIGDVGDSCLDMVEDKKAKSPKNSLESKSIGSVATAFRVLLGLIPNECNGANNTSTALLEVACLLAKALNAVALSLSRGCQRPNVSLSDDACSSIDFLVQVGLEAQFWSFHAIADLPKAQRDIIVVCLDSIAECTRAMWFLYLKTPVSATGDASEMLLDADDDAVAHHAEYCDGTCLKVTKLLAAGNANGSHDWLPCLCRLLPLPAALTASSDSEQIFQRDCSMMLFERLTTHERCALMSSLRPRTSNEDIDRALTTHPMGKLFISSSDPRLRATHAMISLSPLFILSAVSTATGSVDGAEFLENGAGDESNVWNLQNPNITGRDFARDLSSCLGQVLYGKYLDAVSNNSSRALCTVAYLAVDRMHELCDLALRIALDSPDASPDTYGPAIREILSSPLSTIAFLIGRPFSQELTALSDESHRRHRDSLYDAVEETYRTRRIALLSTCATGLEESLSPEARIAKWKCLANTCQRSSVSEMAQIRSRRNNRSARFDGNAGFDGDESIEEGVSTKNPLVCLLRSAFADESPSFRLAAAEEVGRILLENRSSLLYALFSTPSNWRRQDADSGSSSYVQDPSQCASLEHVVIPLFLEIDRLLCRYCHVPQSQLSFTMGPSVISDKASTFTSTDATRMLSFQRSAIMSLSSLCRYADIESPCGLLVFENAIARLIRLWTAGDTDNQDGTIDVLNSASTSAIAFGELIRLNSMRSLRSILVKHSYDRFIPRLFSDVLVPSTGMVSSAGSADAPGVLERENRERQFRLLLAFIGSFLLPAPEKPTCEIKTATVNGSYCMHCVLEFVEEVLPFVMSAFVMAKDHDSLLLVTGFKLFLMGENRKIDKAVKKAARIGADTNGLLRDELLGSSPRAVTQRTSGIDTGAKDLAEQTKLLCLAPETVEHILPRILMANDSSQLLFFLEKVLLKKMSLHQMISSRHKLILKTIVSEFGRTGDVVGAEHALRTAAKAKDNDSAEVPGSSGSRQGDDHAAACLWVSSSFMYLLVNVVQQHWKSRTPVERIRALRSLKWIIKFLSPTDAPQYLPQIMATVNTTMGSECNSSDESCSAMWQIRHLAIQVLSEFIRTAIVSQYEMIGSNLALIVVSLFPVLAADASTVASDPEINAYKEAAKVAVDLLEWLTQGNNGQNLAPYFQDIPFLPPTKALDKVRDALKTNGVNFDDLHVFSSTQRALSVRDSLTSDGGTSNGEENVVIYSSSSQAALRRRLNVVQKLLSHESASVRRVVLQHLIDLLRANRGPFTRLVESDEGSSPNRFVTVSSGSDAMNGTVTSTVDSLLQRCCTEVDFESKLLLATCLGEVGAIGANLLGEMRMDPHRAETAGDDSSLWRLKQAPWQSSAVRYELKVVTTHLVVALKAAPSSGDQHKIAFAIQQLLELLDEHAKMSNRSDSSSLNVGQALDRPARGQMSDWLREQLSDAGVVEIIEPYWSSNFIETERFGLKEPPFFRNSSSYFSWLSYWCRSMLKRSNDDGRNNWCSFFYATRTAVRSRAGMPLAEFIVPLLVLDRLCNGNGNDERSVINEFLSVFDFSDKRGSKMSQSERQKAVNCAFMILDTLQHWAERETEERYHSPRSTSVARSARRKEENNGSERTCWLWEESVAAVDRLMKAVPLSFQANAAAAVGMHARALRLMEMAARAAVVESVYDNVVDVSADPKASSHDGRSPGGKKVVGTHVIGSIDTQLLKKVLGQLNDCETMEGMINTSDVASSAHDDIMVKESKGEWSAALYDYERALELDESSMSRRELEQGSLRCLLELGQLESVLTQVNGIVHSQDSRSLADESERMASLYDSHATPYAVEAAWRLGRWSTLTQLLNDTDQQATSRRCIDSDGLYRVSLGSAMQGLCERSESKVAASIRKARLALMSDLSNVARDSYSRSYSYLVRLHCLREVENACEIMCCDQTVNDSKRLGLLASSCGRDGWNWDGRLAVVSGSGSSDIIDVRLALSRLAGDGELEGSLYLTVGKKARKAGLVNIAANFLSQAEACCTRQRPGVDQSAASTSHIDDLLSSIRLQSAKLKHQSGESTAALRILGLGNVSGMLQNDDRTIQSLALSHERNIVPGQATNDRDQAADISRFSRRLLQSTRWMVEGGIKGGSEVMERFRIVQRLSPQWEKGYFQFAKYVDSVLESQVAALAHRLGKSQQLVADDDALRQTVILSDERCMKYLLLALEQYINALKFNSKHVYQALPRLLSLWFDFTSYQRTDAKVMPTSTRSQSIGEVFARNQAEANDLLSKALRMIPAHCFYTAMPQLISRIGHRNAETAQIVRGILTRVLTKHPGQAMWSLAWLLQSADKERVYTGEEIFKDAQTALLKRKDKKSQKLLASSKVLFAYLIGLAKYEPKEGNMRSFSVKTFRSDSDLVDFIPPVQEALSVSPSTADKNAADAFPIMVPRIRNFCTKVQIMSSKAKPKKAKAFVVPADQILPSRASSSIANSSKASQPGDIGEIHFLLKREARGDLRKDARVQNLNNVINRLLAVSNSSGTSGASRQHRRLHLRTFAVTCLSEDCGILEWVPNTASMRSLVMQSYNPQASPFSVRRRGKRLGNYGDGMSLKSGYEKIQNVFFKQGNLHQAAAMFEETCLKPYPPLLYWYFVQHFMDPHSWYEARTQFTLSCAAWSAVGHVIGLGDRHSENILVDTSSGQCVHVDFDCIFDKGLHLPKPEVVPFRLSPNMIDAFGPIGADGVYTGGLKAAMTTLRDNRDMLLSVLEPFTKDPIIDWKRQKSSQKTSKVSASDQRQQQAKRSITTIDERLKGIYNLRNPNFRKIKRTDGWSQDADDEMMHMIPLSVEGQVHKMITEATSHENLVQLYSGWMPWV